MPGRESRGTSTAAGDSLRDPLTELEHLYHITPVGLGLLDRRLRFIRVNRLLAEMDGKPIEEHMGRCLDEVVPELAPQIRPIVMQVLDTGKAVLDVEIRGKPDPVSRVERIWLVSYQPVKTSAGDVYAVNAIARDITALKRTEEELRERLRFEILLSGLSATFVNIHAAQLDSQINDALRQIVEFVQVDRSSLIQFSPNLQQLTVTHSYAVEGFPCTSGMVLHEKFRWYCQLLRDGSVVRLGSSRDLPPDAIAEREWARGAGLKSHLAVPILIDGSPVCVLVVGAFGAERPWTDELISRLRLIGAVLANALARKRAETDIHRTHAELAHVTRVVSMGQLATSLAHEVNQPLCAVVSNAQAALRMMASANPDLADVQAALRDIVSDGKRAGEVIRRAHTLLKKQERKPTPLDINDVVSTVVALLQSHALIRRVMVRCEPACGLPPVLGDRVQLQQVVLNLASNGIEAIPDGDTAIREVVITTGRSGDQVLVGVRDSGIGLSPQVAAKLFEPFFTTKPHGLGMGLAISHAIIQAHGGRMWAASNADVGATFHFAVPILSETPA